MFWWVESVFRLICIDWVTPVHSVFVLWCLFGAFLVETVKEDLQRVGVTEEDGKDGADALLW